MGREWLLASLMLLLMTMLVVGCGISQEKYDALLAERDTLEKKKTDLQATVSELELDLNELEKEKETFEDNLSEAQTEIGSLKGDLSDVETQIETLEDSLSDVESNLSDAETLLGDVRDELALTKGRLFRMEEVFGELLFFDDFEDGAMERWDSHGTMDSWSVVQEAGNNILQSLGQDGKPAPLITSTGTVETPVDVFIVDANDWTDYTLEFKIRVVQLRHEGAASVNLKFLPGISIMHPQSYNLIITPNQISLHRRYDYMSLPAKLPQSAFESWYGDWMDIKVEVYGANIKAYVNGVLHIDYTDPEPVEIASISFGTDLEYAYIYLDDVLVTRAK